MNSQLELRLITYNRQYGIYTPNVTVLYTSIPQLWDIEQTYPSHWKTKKGNMDTRNVQFLVFCCLKGYLCL